MQKRASKADKERMIPSQTIGYVFVASQAVDKTHLTSVVVQGA